MKKYIGLLLAVLFLITSVTATYASTNDQNAADSAKKLVIQQKLDAVAAKHGGNIVSLNNAKPSNNVLKFDSVEDFDKALDTLHVAPINNDNANSIISPMNFTNNFTRDYGIYLGPLEVAGVRNVVTATETWNSYIQHNVFLSWSHQYSYAFVSLGATWAQQYSSQNIINGGLTLTSGVNGIATLGVQIAGYQIGYSWPAYLYSSWNAI